MNDIIHVCRLIVDNLIVISCSIEINKVSVTFFICLTSLSALNLLYTDRARLGNFFRSTKLLQAFHRCLYNVSRVVGTQTFCANVLDADSIQRQFQNALKENKDTFIASIIDLYTSDAQLQTCDPKQVVCEALKAATLHLPVNKALGFSYIVVYNNNVKDANGQWQKVPTPTFILGYKGYIQLAMRTGQYKTINADLVYEGEHQQVSKLSGEINFAGEKKSDKVVGYFCYFELLNGFTKTLYMSVEDMAKYAKHYSKGISRAVTAEQLMAKANDGLVTGKVGWEGNFNDMAIKTSVHNH